MTRRKTQEEFEQEVFERVGHEFEVWGMYERNRKKILFYHTVCGRTFESTPTNFLKTQQCSHCGKLDNYLARIKSVEQFEQEVTEKGQGEYAVLTPYCGASSLVTFQHQKCGHIYETRATNFLSGSRCPQCAKQNHGRRLTTETFTHRVESRYGDEYQVLGNYLSYTDPILMKHRNCETEFEVTPKTFFRGQRCPQCTRGRSPKQTTNSFKKRIEELVGQEYELRSDYITSRDEVTLYHTVCQQSFQITPDRFNRGCRCPICSRRQVANFLAKTPEQFEREVFEQVGDEYRVVTPYVRSKSKITIEHRVCGLTYEVTPNTFLRGRRCPHCAKTKRKGTIIKKHL